MEAVKFKNDSVYLIFTCKRTVPLIHKWWGMIDVTPQTVTPAAHLTSFIPHRKLSNCIPANIWSFIKYHSGGAINARESKNEETTQEQANGDNTKGILNY